ncbi:MAG: hypothetical protein JW943_10100 [Deltaproteobacteria bacterium]|nr:hypothetical protein [Deltaproteobacteria bacterium]
MKKEKWHTVSYRDTASEQGRHVSAEVEIGESSPWFSGHFPIEPVLPGIALLSMVSELIRHCGAVKRERITLAGIRRVRFRLPVRPGALLLVSVSPPYDRNQGAYNFKIAAKGETVCSGIMDVITVTEQIQGFKEDSK